MNLLSFRLAYQWYAIELEHITEVLWMVYLEEMPSSPPEVLGLLNMRHASMPVLDLRKRFQLPEAPVRLYTPLIACQHEGQHMALLVDEAKEVMSIHSQALRPIDISPYISHSFEYAGEQFRLIRIEQLLTSV